MSASTPGFVPLEFQRLSSDEMLARAERFDAQIQRRRTVRHFTDEPVPMEVLDACIRSAGSAPSGAHKQPWTFVIVTDPEVKSKIREAAEEEERENYSGRMNPEWIEDLEPLGTDDEKPFLEIAPALIVVMRQAWGLGENGRRRQHYYTQESVGIASGFLLTALHLAGLATLTHTPSPMGFLTRILGRPQNEKPFLLIPVGYATEDCAVPDLARKPLDEIRVRV